MLKAAPNQTIDLNYAVAQLKIQKRRIYDITNVLEGVGLIMKVENNNVAWCSDSAMAPQFETTNTDTSEPYGQQHLAAVEAANQEEQHTKKEEKQLEQYLGMLKARAAQFPLERHPSQVSSTPGASLAPDGASQHQHVLPHGVTDARPHLYVPYSNITELPMFGNDTVIGIRAPIGTSVDVPDPEQSARNGVPRYQLYMNSKTAETQEKEGPETSKPKPIDVYLMRPQVLPGNSRESKSGKTEEDATKDR